MNLLQISSFYKLFQQIKLCFRFSLSNSILFLPFCWLLLIVSCADKRSSDLTVHLVLEGEIKIPMDATTSGISEYVTTYNHLKPSDSIFNNNQTYLCYLNRGKEIQFYDLESKEIIHRISFQSAGPNAIIGRITAFNVVSADSIFVSSFPVPFVFRVNLLGEVKEKIMLGPFDKAVEPISNTSKPLLVTNNHIYSSFYTTLPPTDFHSPLSGDELDNVIIDIDLKSKKQKLQYHLPSPYTKNKLLSHYYYNPSIEKGKRSGEILISFGAHDSISVTDFNNFDRNYYAGSSLFDEIPSLEKQDGWDHYRLNYMYEGIIYDEFRNYYYRFLTLPKKKDELKSEDLKTGNVKDIAIIILNGNFEKIGETIIDPSYSNMTYFINEEGLNLFNIEKGLTDEDNLYFGTFKVSNL
ncbi:uncharacterized protein DUF4221 [Roseivirga ehrenbergii]|nr:uncharacterized protein DUF4221 [Roseivirga ehrenbergii]